MQIIIDNTRPSLYPSLKQGLVQAFLQSQYSKVIQYNIDIVFVVLPANDAIVASSSGSP